MREGRRRGSRAFSSLFSTPMKVPSTHGDERPPVILGGISGGAHWGSRQMAWLIPNPSFRLA